MDNETCAEWLIKKKAPAYTYAIKDVMIFLCVIGMFLALTTVWGVLILATVSAAIFFMFQGMNLEFEYLIMNDQSTIDKIMGKVRRKKAWGSTMEEAQIVAPSDSYMLRGYERAGTKTLDFSSCAPGTKTYSLIRQAGANTTKVIFEPNDRVLHCLQMRSPEKVIQQYNPLKF